MQSLRRGGARGRGSARTGKRNDKPSAPRKKTAGEKEEETDSAVGGKGRHWGRGSARKGQTKDEQDEQGRSGSTSLKRRKGVKSRERTVWREGSRKEADI